MTGPDSKQPRRWLKTRSLGASLAMAFTGVLVLATVGAVVALVGLEKVSAEYEHAIDTADGAARLADQAERALLEARRRERDFLLRWREEGYEVAVERYVGPMGDEPVSPGGRQTHHRQHVVDLDDAVSRLRQALASPETRADELRPLVDALERHPELVGAPLHYRALFEKTVELVGQRGHEDTGEVGQMRAGAHRLETWLEEQPASRSRAELEAGLLQLRRAEKDYLLRGATSWVAITNRDGERAESHAYASGLVDDVRDRSDALRLALSALPAGRAEEPLAALQAFDASFRDVVDHDREIAETEDEFRAKASSIQAAVSDVAAVGRASAKTHYHNARASHDRTLRWVLTCVLGMLLLAVAVAWALIQQIQIPVRALDAAARRIGAGDFSTRAVVDSEDEFGTLAEAFNDLVERIQRVLENLLPRAIARKEMSQEGQLIAEKRTEATVLFADIVGYTRISSHLRPQEVVQRLSEFFDAFDALAVEHGVVKIKTIGDNYMAAAGVLDEPEGSRPPLHRMADFALAMRDRTAGLAQGPNESFALRIGLHTGELVAGVIGQKRRIFDLWGHTVNMASRMESTGVENRVQVSKEVVDQLQDDYEFERRAAQVEVKNVGRMQTWFLVGRRDATEG